MSAEAGRSRMPVRETRWGRRERVVLAVLSVLRPAAASQAQLGEALWPEGPPPTAAKVIQGCVSRLRGTLGTAAILTVDGGYRLAPDVVTAADRFESGVGRACELLDLGQADRAVFAIEEALRGWTGPPYQELDHWAPATIEDARLHELLRDAEELQVAALLDAGEPGRARVLARVHAVSSPLRERRWTQLALAAYRCGDQVGALEAIRRCRNVLSEELGVDLGPDLATLQSLILHQDPALAGHSAPVPDYTCPWPGLSPYEASDAESFFGRDEELATALDLLANRGALAVVGPSGIGKSSFVRAGLVATLRARGRSVADVVPTELSGNHPEEQGVDVLALDQAEDLFTLPSHLRSAALARLAAFPGAVIVALRSDRMSEAGAQPDLARIVERGLFLLRGLGAAALTAAVEQPAAQHGLRLEPGLVELLLRDLEGAPAALPLFSHSLAETWALREGRTLTVASYVATGGVRGAVAKSAEQVYAGLAENQQAALRSLMLRLVSPGPEGEPHRARLAASQLQGPEQAELVEALIRSRLLTLDQGSVSLTHEALVAAWPRLQSWLEDDVEGRRVFQHLTVAARAWDGLARPDSELYRGGRLARARDWAGRTDIALNDMEKDFLAASTALEASTAAELETRLRRQARTNRSLRGLVGVVALAAVVAALVGVVALGQRDRAVDAVRRADASRVGAAALTDDDPARAGLLAAAAARLSPSTTTARNLSAVLARNPELVRAATYLELPRMGAVATAGGRVFWVDASHVVHAYDRNLGSVGASDTAVAEPDELPIGFAVSSSAVAVGGPVGEPAAIRFLDPMTLNELPLHLQGLPTWAAAVIAIRFSHDGTRVGAMVEHLTDHGVGPGVVMVWDARTGRRIGHVIPTLWSDLAFSGDDRTLLMSNPYRAYDIATGAKRWEVPGAAWMAIASHGNMLGAATEDGTGVRLINARTGAQTAVLGGHSGNVRQVAFSPDGTTVMATGDDGLALVWDVRTGRLLHRVDTGSRLVAAAYTSDDNVVTAVSARRQLGLWDLAGRRTFVRQLRVAGLAGVDNGMVRVSHDGASVALGGYPEGQLSTRFAAISGSAGSTSASAVNQTWSSAGAWSPDDARYAVGYGKGWVQVVDPADGKESVRRRVLSGLVMEVAYTDDEHLAVTDASGRTVLLDAATLRPVGTPVTIPQDPWAMTGSADGYTVLLLAGGTRQPIPSAGAPVTSWYLLDLAAGTVVDHGQVPMHSVTYTSFAPDGKTVALAGRDGEVGILDLTTGELVRPPVRAMIGDTLWVAENPDGTKIAATSDGGTVTLWDAGSGEPVANTQLPASESFSAAGFAADGMITVATITGDVFGWDPSVDAAVDFACRVAGRDLTYQEWTDAFGDRPYRTTCSSSG